MKFLLFFVSFIFSMIFYSFYNFSNWKSLSWAKISNPVIFHSFTWNLLIESFIFLLIWIFFLYFFSDLKSKWQSKLWNYKIEALYFLFYICLIFYVYFINKWFDFVSIVILLLFILSDVLFNYISNFKLLAKEKIRLRYIWLILNYVSWLLSIYYINKNWINFLFFLILIYNIVFNFLVHKKYTNYISLLNSILIILFLVYKLSFLLIWLVEKYF